MSRRQGMQSAERERQGGSRKAAGAERGSQASDSSPCKAARYPNQSAMRLQSLSCTF
jgi:hypothetical protein